MLASASKRVGRELGFSAAERAILELISAGLERISDLRVVYAEAAEVRFGQTSPARDGGWTTSINALGQVEWIPPPELDIGQARINSYHHVCHEADPEPESG
jgi:hypothetical protein